MNQLLKGESIQEHLERVKNNPVQFETAWKLMRAEIEAREWREIEMMRKMKGMVEQWSRGLVEAKSSLEMVILMIDDYCRKVEEN